MYRNIIRVVAVLFAAFAAAMALPGFYRMVPASWHGDYKKIVYSEVLGDFIISKSIYSNDPSDRSGIRYEIRDSKGNAYTPEQADTLAVLENASQLIYEGRLPETVCGVAVTPERVSAHDYTVYFGDGGGRDYGLLDLKDKLSYVSNDYRTQDLFRFGRGGIEFLDAPSNRVDMAKTAAFRRALAGAGFVSPASGTWTPADRTDAETLGYFMTDSRGGLFRMGMCGGEPEVERIALPEGCVVRNLSFADRPEFLAMMLTEKGEVYRMGRDYTFRRLPLPDTRAMRVAMHGMLLFNKFVYAYHDHTTCYVTDVDYRMIDSRVPLYHAPYALARAAFYVVRRIPLAAGQRLSDRNHGRDQTPPPGVAARPVRARRSGDRGVVWHLRIFGRVGYAGTRKPECKLTLIAERYDFASYIQGVDQNPLVCARGARGGPCGRGRHIRRRRRGYPQRRSALPVAAVDQ